MPDKSNRARRDARRAVARDVRTIRLYDLAPYEWVGVECVCGRIVLFPNGLLQRKHKIPSDCLVYDLQFRFRCANCGSNKGFRITVTDQRGVHDSSNPAPHIVIVKREQTVGGIVPGVLLKRD